MSSSSSSAMSGAAMGMSSVAASQASIARKNSENALRAVCKNNYNEEDCAGVCVQKKTIKREELPGWKVLKTKQYQNVCITKYYQTYTETGINGYYISYTVLGVILVVLLIKAFLKH